MGLYKYLSDKGSTMVLVVCTMTILSMLGLSIMTFAVTDYRIKRLDYKDKDSFYIAEAGLEEAYTIICEQVEKAVTEGKKAAQDTLDTILLMNVDDENYDDYFYTDGVGGGTIGMMKEEVVKGEMDKVFRKTFQDYIAANLVNALKNEDKDGKDNYGAIGKQNTYTVVKTKNFGSEKDGNEFHITLQSQSNKNGVYRTLETTFAVKCPESYDEPYYVENKILHLKKNVLWKNALTVMGDMIVKGKNVTVNTNNGAVYVRGRGPGDPSKNPLKYGGIMVGYQQSNTNTPGSLTINGNVITANYLQTRGKNSHITVNGEVFCESLVIQELDPDEADEADENCSITVNGNVNTYDDIKLNGEKSSIWIKGSYYGFSSGIQGYNRSSSIIINADDICEENGSKLKIDGQGQGKSYYEVQAGMKTSGVFIAGVKHLDLGGDDRLDNAYLTGESISYLNHSDAYAIPLDGNKLDPTEDSYKFREENVQFSHYSINKSDNGVGEPSGYILVEKYNIKDGNPTDFTARDLGQYFVKVTEQENNFFKKTANIQLNNVWYSEGAYILGDSIYNPKVDQSLYSDAFRKNGYEYAYMINRMGDPQDTWSNENTRDVQLTIDELFHYPNNVINKVANEEIVFVNSNRNSSLFIRGINGQELSGTTYRIDLNNDSINPDFTSKFKGIIVTKGDVYISGEIDFTGIIVTEGDLHIIDDNPKTFTNDYDEGSITADNNYVIKRVYEDILNPSNISIGNRFKQEGNYTIRFALTSKVAIPNLGGGSKEVKTYYRNRSDLVRIKSWKRIQ